jgi:hydrogenase maturation protease
LSKDLPIVEPPGNDSGTILFGIGNCGRSDDGLGWAFIDRLQQETTFTGQIEYRYQLQVEDAALISNARQVVFVDSYHGSLPNGFQLVRCEPSREFEFTTHVLRPEAVLCLCRDLYGSLPRADVLLIQGHSWELQTGMSPDAERHLENALRFFKDKQDQVFFMAPLRCSKK